MSSVPVITYSELITDTVAYIKRTCKNIDNNITTQYPQFASGWQGNSQGVTGAWETAVGGAAGKGTKYQYILNGNAINPQNVSSTTVQTQLTDYIQSKRTGLSLNSQIMEGSFLQTIEDIVRFFCGRVYFAESALSSGSPIRLLLYTDSAISIPGESLLNENTYKLIAALDINTILDTIFAGVTTDFDSASCFVKWKPRTKNCIYRIAFAST